MTGGAVIDNLRHRRPCVGGAMTDPLQPTLRRWSHDRTATETHRFPQFIHGLRGRGYELPESNDAERRSTLATSNSTVWRRWLRFKLQTSNFKLI
jgi:hypothetical protein